MIPRQHLAILFRRIPTYFTGTLILGLVMISLRCWGQEKLVGPAPLRPNIILIMSDDMGYSDLGCYGGEIRTPNLDQLAASGLRFSQFYNAARCCPTRAALLTGLYPHQAGMGWMTSHQKTAGIAPYQGDLSTSAVTLAEVAKLAGYSSMMTGKWHVSYHTQADGPKHSWPLQRGFDRYYGTIKGGGNFYDPATLCRGNQLISPLADPAYPAENYYYTNAISDHAIRFVEERDQAKPFFMYMAYTAAHWPMQAPAEDIAAYKGHYDQGWEEVRANRLANLKELGLVDSSLAMAPLGVKPWVKEQNKTVLAGRMEIYASMISIMDEGIGKLVDALDEAGILDNTIIIFLQDNGGCAEEIGTKGPTGTWAKEGEQHTALAPDGIEYNVIPRITREGTLIMRGKGIKGGPDTTYVAYGKQWAHASNTPFREYKHWVHEGGISTPLIVHYPELIERKGAIVPAPSHIIDIMPTLVELMGVDYPDTFKRHDILPMEGVSLLPLFRGEAIQRDEAIFWEHEGNRAVRKGRWKLVSKGQLIGNQYGGWTDCTLGSWELYDMTTDRGETHDLSAQYPELVQELAQEWDLYADRIGVFPTPWRE